MARFLPCRYSGAKPPIRWRTATDGRAECPACHKRVRLTNRGRLWPHGTRAPERGADEACRLEELRAKVAPAKATQAPVTIAGAATHANAYYRFVGEAAEVAVLTGEYRRTGCYYGASEVLRGEQTPLVLKRGAEIHVLYGGAFAVQDGEAFELTFTDRDASPFEHNTRKPVRFEAGQLAIIPQAEATQPAGGYRRKA